MTLQHSPLREAIRVALAATAMYTCAAAAQDSTQDPTTLDRIEVTGSRIRQVDMESAAPVLTISRDDIERQGFQSIADILQTISATGAPAISRAMPLSSGENVGGQFIDMRNLGTVRTLVLVNGQRIEGVTGVRVDVTAGTVTVGSSGDQPADAIAAAVDEAGYTLVAGR